jgi:putative ABC transport system permease protein
VLHDLRHVLRSLRKSPGFTSVAVLTLALGIGANTAIFSVVHGVLMRPLAYPHPDALMDVETVFESGASGNTAYPDFEDLRDQNRSFAAMAVYANRTASAAADGQGFRVAWAHVSASFFAVLDVAPAVGRVFSADDERAGQRVAVASYGYWQNRLGGRTDLTARTIQLGDQGYAVIGVMPRGYDFPAGTDLWVPREPATENRTAQNWHVLGRLRTGISRDRAQQDLTAIARRVKQRYGDDTYMTGTAVRPVLEQLVGSVRPALIVLLGAAGVLLLVACVNVVNLLLARALSRDREMALRLALGARPSRLARGFLLEPLALSLAGAALGALFAVAGVRVLLAFEPGRLPRVHDIGVDWSVLAFALGIAVVAAAGMGLVPAIRAARHDARAALASGQRTQGGGVVTQSVRGALVAAQVALTIVLLLGAGLLGRSFLKLLAVNPGYRTGDAVVMDAWLPSPRDTAGEIRNTAFLERLIARVRALPGVERVGGVNAFPLIGGSAGNGTFLILQRPDEVTDMEGFRRLGRDPNRTGNAEFRVASAGYFGAMGIPLIRGRLFDERDTREAPHVALISASLAQTRWPDEDPLGKIIQFGNMDGDPRPFTVVGVVGDVQERGLGVPPRPTFYAEYRQRPRTAWQFHIAMRGQIEPTTLTTSARRIARELDPEVPTRFQTLEDVVSTSLADRRFVLMLVALFAVLAFALATMGLYSVIAYIGSRRTPEIGVRMALGARAADVVRLLVWQGAVLAGIGIGVGLVAALALTRFLSSLLYGIGTLDPVTFVVTSVTLLLTALAASWLPALRAARIDPMKALRQE